MNNSSVIKGNICQTKNPQKIDLYNGAFAVCVEGLSKGIFHSLPEEYASLTMNTICLERTMI